MKKHQVPKRIAKQNERKAAKLAARHENHKKIAKELLPAKRNKDGKIRKTNSQLRLLSWVGSKYGARDLIVSHFPKSGYGKVVSPFFGSGAVEWYVNRQLKKEVVGYDLSRQLVTFWQQILKDNMGLAVLVDELVPRNGVIIYEKECKQMLDAIEDSYEGATNELAEQRKVFRYRQRGANHEFGLVEQTILRK